MGLDLQRLKRVLTTDWTRPRFAGIAYSRGLWRTSIWLRPSATLHDRLWRAAALKNKGDAAAATTLMDGALSELPGSASYLSLLNTALDVLISLGRYRDALALDPGPSVPRNWVWALAQSNLAEAEYCQGLIERADARLWSPEVDAASAASRLARTWVALQRAWLAVEQGDGSKALAVLAPTSPSHSSLSYRAEWHFTAAAAHSLAGHPEAADKALEAGAKIAVRSSSVRNALALKGILMLARGKQRKAERWLSRAAAHRWRGQGGGALLAWGDVLAELGKREQARAAWRRAVTQDPQSSAARIAATR